MGRRLYTFSASVLLFSSICTSSGFFFDALRRIGRGGPGGGLAGLFGGNGLFGGGNDIVEFDGFGAYPLWKFHKYNGFSVRPVPLNLDIGVGVYNPPPAYSSPGIPGPYPNIPNTYQFPTGLAYPLKSVPLESGQPPPLPLKGVPLPEYESIEQSYKNYPESPAFSVSGPTYKKSYQNSPEEEIQEQESVNYYASVPPTKQYQNNPPNNPTLTMPYPYQNSYKSYQNEEDCDNYGNSLSQPGKKCFPKKYSSNSNSNIVPLPLQFESNEKSYKREEDNYNLPTIAQESNSFYKESRQLPLTSVSNENLLRGTISGS